MIRESFSTDINNNNLLKSQTLKKNDDESDE